MSRLYGHLASAPEDVVGVGGRVVDDGSSIVGMYATRLGLLNPYVHKGRIAYLVTANCLFRRRALLEIGGFDERFKTPGGEDPELSFRLLRAGYRLEYAENAMVEHSYPSSWRSFYRLFLRYGRGCRRAMESLMSKGGHDGGARPGAGPRRRRGSGFAEPGVARGQRELTVQALCPRTSRQVRSPYSDIGS